MRSTPMPESLLAIRFQKNKIPMWKCRNHPQSHAGRGPQKRGHNTTLCAQIPHHKFYLQNVKPLISCPSCLDSEVKMQTGIESSVIRLNKLT